MRDSHLNESASDRSFEPSITVLEYIEALTRQLTLESEKRYYLGSRDQLKRNSGVDMTQSLHMHLAHFLLDAAAEFVGVAEGCQAALVQCVAKWPT